MWLDLPARSRRAGAANRKDEPLGAQRSRSRRLPAGGGAGAAGERDSATGRGPGARRACRREPGRNLARRDGREGRPRRRTRPQRRAGTAPARRAAGAPGVASDLEGHPSRPRRRRAGLEGAIPAGTRRSGRPRRAACSGWRNPRPGTSGRRPARGPAPRARGGTGRRRVGCRPSAAFPVLAPRGARGQRGSRRARRRAGRRRRRVPRRRRRVQDRSGRGLGPIPPHAPRSAG